MLRKTKGLTFVELIIATLVISFEVMATVNLVRSVTRYTYSSLLKTYSYNIAQENLEALKSYPFGALKLTPDSQLPEPLSNLEVSDNPWGNPADTDNITYVGGSQMKVYKIIQNAREGTDKNIEAVTQSDLATSDLKYITVIVHYTDKSASGAIMDKRTTVKAIVSNAEATFGGVTIRGRVLKKDKSNGRIDPPGFGSTCVVYVKGHPEYSAVVATNNGTDDEQRGYYTMYNVMPGTYELYCMGDEFESVYYENNPLVVDTTVTEIDGVNFIAPKINSTEITGRIYVDFGAGPVALDKNLFDTLTVSAAGCDIGITFSTSLKDIAANGDYEIINVNPEENAVTVTAYGQLKTGEYFFGSYTSNPLELAANNNGINITLSNQPTSGIVTVYTYDANDKTTLLPTVKISFLDKNTDTITMEGTTNGSGYVMLTPSAGVYTVIATKANYDMEGGPYELNVSGGTPIQKIYLYAVGGVSGTLTESLSGLPPTPLNLKAYSNSQVVSETYSNTSTGQYELQHLRVGASNSVRLFVDGTPYSLQNPISGTLSGISISQGTTTPNQNFTVEMTASTITGYVMKDGVTITTGVIIIAQPVSVTNPPHSYAYSSPNAAWKYTNSYRRYINKTFSTISGRDGKYKLEVPYGTNYDIYAYYSKTSFPASVSITTGTIINYYMLRSNASPNTTQNLTGTWITPY